MAIKSKLQQLIFREGRAAGVARVNELARADVAGALVDGWEDDAIEACVAFGIADPEQLGADDFCEGFAIGAAEQATARGIEPEPSGAPTVPAPAQLEQAAAAAGIPAAEVPALLAIVERPALLDEETTIRQLSVRHLGVSSFVSVGSDSLDFVDVSREAIGDALRAAYAAGKAARS